MRKLGLIAGAGRLPVEIVHACAAAGRDLFVLRLAGLAEPELGELAPGVGVGLAQWGKMVQALKEHGCEAVCFAGRVPRPDFAALKPDMRALAALPRLIAAAGKGDDALLRQVLFEFEQEGFVIEGPEAVMVGLTIGEGPLGRIAPGTEHHADIEKAMRVARAIGVLDVGQAVVVADGLVLAVEAQEGTDAMLERCATLSQALRSPGRGARGVLAKAAKPIQDRRVDLPTIGPATLVGAARAGLAGIVGEVGSLLVVERAQVIRAADELGLFVVGLPVS